MSFRAVNLFLRVSLAIALAAMILFCTAQAQEPQQPGTSSGKASITGVVTDQKGAAIPGAQVLLDAGAGVKLEVDCDAEGKFAFNDLFPGTYSITAVAANFPDKVQNNISVTAGQNLSLKVAMRAPTPQTEQAAASQAAGSVASGPSGEKGSINGTVTDPSGAVLPGATVSLEGGGLKLGVVSSITGTYNFKSLPPGTYTLTARGAGFGKKVLDNIALAAAQELALDVPLEPATNVENVNVQSSNVGQVETESATVSGTIEQKEVVTLQLNGRNFSQLVALAPGVSNQTGQDEAKVGVQGSVKYSVNGGRVEYNTFEVDGSDVLNTGLNRSASTLMVYPSIDAIQEIKVLTSNYGAQYGRTASGTVQVTTKSGTAQLHGNVYEFIRNEAFNARNYFDFTSKAPLYRRHDFGGTIGGPLTIPHVYNTKKDKTFFFFSEEARLEKTPTDYNQAVPGLKERGLIMTAQGIQPNLSPPNLITGQVGQVFDFTDVCPPQGSGNFNRRQFPDCPGTPINGSSSDIRPTYYLEGAPPPFSGAPVDKNAVLILNANQFPLPNSAAGCNYALAPSFVLDPSDPYRCYNAAVSPSTYWREELFRIDHIFTQKLKVSFRYLHDEWNTTVLTPQWNYLSVTNPSAATFQGIQNYFTGPGMSLVFNLTHAISSTLINNVGLSYVNSKITLTDRNGPGGARFQRNPALDQPLIPTAGGGCNPQISVDPLTGVPQCAIGYIFNNGFGGKMPGVAILGTNAAYGGRGFAEDPSYMPWEHTNPTYSVRDDVGKALGKHTLTFGAQYVYSQRNQDNNVIGAASGDTQGLLTFANQNGTTGNAFADFLLGGVAGTQTFIQSFTQDSGQHRYYQRYQLAEPYFQDDWKVTSRFTVNLGLRLSLFGTYREKNHSAWNWDPARFNPYAFTVDPAYGNLLYNNTALLATDFQSNPSIISAMGLVQCGVAGTPAGCMTNHLFNWAPRVGFAWDPKGDGKTSIRAGYGIFYEHGTGNEANTGSLEASAPVVLSVTEPFPASYPCIGNVGYGPAYNATTMPCNHKNNPNVPPAGSLYPIDVTSIPTAAVWPYSQQWSFGVQRELARNFIVNAAYVGSKGTHLTIERQLNQLAPLASNLNPFGPTEPLTLDDCTLLPNAGGAHPGDGATPFQLQSGTIVNPSSPAYVHLQAACANFFTPNVNSLPGHPYPGLGRVLALQNVADSSYHAFQFTARRTSGALTTGVSYAYSHSIDDSSDRSDPVLVNSYDLRANRASSNFDERHLLTFNYIYQFSFRKLFSNLNDWANERERATAGDTAASSTKCCSGFSERFLDGWEFSGITLIHSGTPFTVINTAGNTGISVTDNAGVSSNLGIADSYPDVARGLARPGNNSQSFGALLENPSQFVAPRGLTFGNAGRNFLNNPRQVNFDMALAKRFKITEGSQLEFRAEAFNIFNHTNFRIYDPDNPGSTGNNLISCYAGPAYSGGYKGSGADCVTGASFLHPVDAHRPRTLQLALKYAF